MKTLGLLFSALFSVVTCSAQDASQYTKQLDGAEAREFRVTIKQVVPGGKAIANGGFYALNSPAPKPLGGSTALDPKQKTTAGSGRQWSPTGDVFITGLPDGLVDGQTWRGWMVREGAHTFTTVFGAYRTVPAYRVTDTTMATVPAKAEAWKPKGTALDAKR